MGDENSDTITGEGLLADVRDKSSTVIEYEVPRLSLLTDTVKFVINVVLSRSAVDGWSIMTEETIDDLYRCRRSSG